MDHFILIGWILKNNGFSDSKINGSIGPLNLPLKMPSKTKHFKVDLNLKGQKLKMPKNAQNGKNKPLKINI